MLTITQPLVRIEAQIAHALTLSISRQVKAELESLDEDIAFHVAPPLCPLMGSPYDFSQTSELIERAAARTEEWLTAGERREIPHEMECSQA